MSIVNTPMSKSEVEATRDSLKYWLKCEPRSILWDLVDRLCNTALHGTNPPPPKAGS